LVSKYFTADPQIVDVRDIDPYNNYARGFTSMELIESLARAILSNAAYERDPESMSGDELFREVAPHLRPADYPLRICQNTGDNKEEYKYSAVNGSTRAALALKV
jgi:hypothetical protein